MAARITELRPLEGWDRCTALRVPQIHKLVSDRTLQMSLFDERDLAEATHPDYAGERLSAEEAVRTYQRLATIERACRGLKSVDLHVRPIRHWTADRVRTPCADGFAGLLGGMAHAASPGAGAVR